MDGVHKQAGLTGWRAMLAVAALYNLGIGLAAMHAPGASLDGRLTAGRR